MRDGRLNNNSNTSIHIYKAQCPFVRSFIPTSPTLILQFITERHKTKINLKQFLSVKQNHRKIRE